MLPTSLPTGRRATGDEEFFLIKHPKIARIAIFVVYFNPFISILLL